MTDSFARPTEPRFGAVFAQVLGRDLTNHRLTCRCRCIVIGGHPVMWQVDKVDQLAQPPLVTPSECEAQAGEVAELGVIMIWVVITLLLKTLAQADIGKRLLYLFQRQRTDRALHADHKVFIQPAG